MRTEALIIILVVIAGSEPARLLHTAVEFVTGAGAYHRLVRERAAYGANERSDSGRSQEDSQNERASHQQKRCRVLVSSPPRRAKRRHDWRSELCY